MWGGGWGLWLRTRDKVNYIQKFHITTIYFLFISLVIVIFFRSYYASLLTRFSPMPYVVLLGSFLLSVVIYYLFNTFFQKPIKIFEKFPNFTQAIQMDYRYLVAKNAEILFQEVMIVLLILFLKDAGISPFYIILLFFIIFGLLHLIWFLLLLRIKKVPKTFGIYFLVVSLVGSFLFPQIILRIPYGFVYNFALHSFFYTIFGAFFLLYYKRIEDISL